MNLKLKNIIDASIFEKLVLEGKKGIFTDELYKIGQKVWDEAQKDIIEKIKQFEKEEKILIITDEDKELLHGFDFTQDKHINAKKRLNKFLEINSK